MLKICKKTSFERQREAKVQTRYIEMPNTHKAKDRFLFIPPHCKTLTLKACDEIEVAFSLKNCNGHIVPQLYDSAC